MSTAVQTKARTASANSEHSVAEDHARMKRKIRDQQWNSGIMPKRRPEEMRACTKRGIDTRATNKASEARDEHVSKNCEEKAVVGRVRRAIGATA